MTETKGQLFKEAGEGDCKAMWCYEHSLDSDVRSSFMYWICDLE